DVKKGEIFSEENLRSVRPNLGLMPRFLPDILGKKARRDIEAATPLSWDLVE
ncbi:MAG: SAF domain-containing protein, partial [Campylobacter sp.]|nr:SAF domain-containing protein [Campylobacter sp.]